MSEQNKSVYIPIIDGADLYISEHYINKKYGYTLKAGKTKRQFDTDKFYGTLDNSLDLIKLREIYKDKYPKKNFATIIDNKEYTNQVINVAFNYAAKEFNHVKNSGGLYVRFGYSPDEVKLDPETRVWIHDGKLCAIRIFKEPMLEKDEDETAEEFQARKKVKHDKKLEYYKRVDGKDGDNKDKSGEVKSPCPASLLSPYFRYDENDKVYVFDKTKKGKSIKKLTSRDQNREYLYNNGFTIDNVKYVRWGRSAGAAREGKVLFVNAKLFDAIHKWNLCGLNIKTNDIIDLASFEAYKSLTLSSIIDTIELRAENILVINSKEWWFLEEKVYATRLVNGELSTKIENVELKNDDVFDGQSLLDASVFSEKYSDHGMLLLRNRFFKSACFNTNIPVWFKDNNITEIEQLTNLGWITFATSIDQIKLITTDSSVKYFKFGSIEQWLEYIAKSPKFGIVKYEKPTHHFGGRMVWTHYQLLNTVNFSKEEVEELLKPSFDYLRKLKDDPIVLRTHLNINRPDAYKEYEICSMFDIVSRLLELNEDFPKTKLYHDFVRDMVIKPYKHRLREGRILVHGNYSTLLGNPMTMLYYIIGYILDSEEIIEKTKAQTDNEMKKEFKAQTDYMSYEDVPLYCPKFNDNRAEFGPDGEFTEYGEDVLCCRAPHSTMGNLFIEENTELYQITRYFNLSDEIVCVDSMRHNLLERLSGADYDSDSVLITNHRMLVDRVKSNYDRFLVPCNLFSGTAKTIKSQYNAQELYELDKRTAETQAKIGEITNVSQSLNSRYWHTGDDSILEDIAKLTCLCGAVIDSAKRPNPANSKKELAKIKGKVEYLEENGKGKKAFRYPQFMQYHEKSNQKLSKDRYAIYNSTMQHIADFVNKNKIAPDKHMKLAKLSDVLVKDYLKKKPSDAEHERIKRIVTRIHKMADDVATINLSQNLDSEQKHQLTKQKQKECDRWIAARDLSEVMMWKLLTLIEDDDNKYIRFPMLRALFSDKRFYKLIENKSSISLLELCEPGEKADVELYGIGHKIVKPVQGNP